MRKSEHNWDVTTERARQIQRELRDAVHEEPLSGPVRLIAGADVSYARGSDHLFAAVIVMDAKTHEIVEIGRAESDAVFPYVPGLLSFREAPAVIEAYDALGTKPDLLICDGQGYAHPRRFGLACHVGVLLDIPTIGSAKNLLVGEHEELGEEKGSHEQLVAEDGEVVGEVVRTRTGVNPVYVSIGHKTTLGEARQEVLRAAPQYKLPEPIRAADHEVNRMRREAGQGG